MKPDNNYIQTKDGEWTYFSEMFQENCHSTFGAKEETWLHYINALEIPQLLSAKKELFILEIGFGTGLGAKETFLAHQKYNSACELFFVSTEIDKNMLEVYHELYAKDLSPLEYSRIRGVKVAGFKKGNFHLIILLGDLRETLEKTRGEWKFDRIYQDAFSPKRNPKLWTWQYFTLLREICTPEAKLSTYSASSSIRKALIKAGWTVQKGEKFGPKRSSTRAKLKGKSDPEIIQQLERSGVPCLSDELLDK